MVRKLDPLDSVGPRLVLEQECFCHKHYRKDQFIFQNEDEVIRIFDIEFTRLIMVSYGVRDFEKHITHLYESNKYLCHEDHMDNLPAYNSEKKGS